MTWQTRRLDDPDFDSVTAIEKPRPHRGDAETTEQQKKLSHLRGLRVSAANQFNEFKTQNENRIPSLATAKLGVLSVIT
jgi:hypothetical protein